VTPCTTCRGYVSAGGTCGRCGRDGRKTERLIDPTGAMAAAALCARQSSLRWWALMAAARAAHWIAPGQHSFGGERTELDDYEAELDLPDGVEKLVHSFPPVHGSWPCSVGCWMVDGNDPACTLADNDPAAAGALS
jgi:hypothetical protein